MSEKSNKSNTFAKRRWGLRILLLWVAFCLRALTLTSQGMWRDEVDQWRFAKDAWSVLWQHFVEVGWNGPLYSPIYRIWITLTGESVYALRYLSLIWGVLGVALIYALGRRLFGDKTAWITATLLAFSPHMVWYSQEVKMYTWIVLLVLGILYTLEKTRDGHHLRQGILVVVLMVLFFYSHILGPLLVPVIIIWFISQQRHSLYLWAGLVGILIVLAVLSLPLLRWGLGFLFQTRETGFPSFTFGEMVLTLLEVWSTGIQQGAWMKGNLSPYSTSLYGLLCLIGTGRLIVKKQFRGLGLLFSWLCLPFLILWAISLYSPMFTDRYLIWIAPAFYFLVAQGILAFRGLERWVAPLILSLLLLFNQMAWFAQSIYPIKPQFPEALSYLKQQRDPGELLLFQIPYNYHVLAYYDKDWLDPWAEAAFTNWRLPDETYQVDEVYVDEIMRSTLGEHQEVWLVYSEVDQWDARELVRLWLETHGTLLDQEYFHGVSLYHYQITS